MSITQELLFLCQHIVDYSSDSGDSIVDDLYEIVQYSEAIVPRLYLMITVGCAYIQMNKVPRIQALQDMLEMCRGVQHPIRGLFLRHFLNLMIKNKLPEGLEKSEEGCLTDAIEFMLVNFIEMNKLWVRMRFIGHSRDRSRRDVERKELKILVGTNLVRLCEMENISLDIYKERVLPQLLEQIVWCDDQTAQEYLMEVIVQVFPDEFHLGTLGLYLQAAAKLNEQVSIRSIVTMLIERLTNYAKETKVEMKLFEVFWQHISEMVANRPSLAINEVLLLSVSLLQLAMTLYPDELVYVDQVLKFACRVLQQQESINGGRILLKLLRVPIEVYKNPLKILPFENYHTLMTFLSHKARTAISKNILRSLIENSLKISDQVQIGQLMEITSPLISNSPDFKLIDAEDFIDSQELVAQVVHLLDSEKVDKHFELLVCISKYFEQGGTLRTRFTFPALVFASIKLLKRIKNDLNHFPDYKTKFQNIFRFVFNLINSLLTSNEQMLADLRLPSTPSEFKVGFSQELCLKLFLQSMLCADYCQIEDMAYEFGVQALLVYEEHISDSKQQFKCISQIVGALSQSSVFSEHSFDTMATKCVLYGKKLLKKPDQCRAQCLCAYLYWPVDNRATIPHLTSELKVHKDGERVLTLLQKALKIADSCMEASQNIQLFVEILNHYIYFYQNGNTFITLDYLHGLVDLIQTNLANIQTRLLDKSLKSYFENTLEYFRNVKFGEKKEFKLEQALSKIEFVSEEQKTFDEEEKEEEIEPNEELRVEIPEENSWNNEPISNTSSFETSHYYEDPAKEAFREELQHRQ